MTLCSTVRFLDAMWPSGGVFITVWVHPWPGSSLALSLSRFLAQTSKFSLDTNDRPEWVQSLMVRRHDRLILQASPGGEA